MIWQTKKEKHLKRPYFLMSYVFLEIFFLIKLSFKRNNIPTSKQPKQQYYLLLVIGTIICFYKIIQ